MTGRRSGQRSAGNWASACLAAGARDILGVMTGMKVYLVGAGRAIPD